MSRAHLRYDRGALIAAHKGPPYRRALRTLVCCSVLEIGALFGMPMRMEEIERLLRSLSGPQVAHTNPEEDEQGGKR